MSTYYEITIQGHLDPCWSDWLAGLQVTHLDGGLTLLSGSLADQSALYGLLEHLRDFNLILISLTSRRPSTQEVDLGD